MAKWQDCYHPIILGMMRENGYTHQVLKGVSFDQDFGGSISGRTIENGCIRSATKQLHLLKIISTETCPSLKDK